MYFYTRPVIYVGFNELHEFFRVGFSNNIQMNITYKQAENNESLNNLTNAVYIEHKLILMYLGYTINLEVFV